MVLALMYGVILALTFVNFHLILRNENLNAFDTTIIALLIVIVLNVALALCFRGNYTYGAYLYRASPFGFLYGPILFLIFKTSRNKNLKELDILHFIPFFISLLGYFALILSDWVRDYFLVFYYQVHYIAMCASWLSYALVVLFSKVKKDQSSKMKHLIPVILVSMLLCLSVLLMFIISRYIYALELIKPDTTASFIAVFMIISLVLIYSYYMRFRAIELPFLIKPKLESIDIQSNMSYKSSPLADKDLELYARKIENYLHQDKFLDPNLSQEILSKELRISKHDLSQVFSRTFNSNFSKYINKLRINYACRLLESEDFNENIDQLIEQCGFSSKASFYRNFTALKECSPLEFRQKQNRSYSNV